MRRVVLVVFAAHISFLTGRLLAGDKPVADDGLSTLNASTPTFSRFRARRRAKF
jgi:hypothetical protein